MEAADLWKLHASELRATWQWRLLAASLRTDTDVEAGARPVNGLGMCALSMLAHNFDEAMPVLLRLCGFRGVATPMLVSAAKIAKTGHVMADYVARDGVKYKNQVLFRSTKHMEGAFRKLADGGGFTDAEREEMFAALKRWVVCDYRLDPTMDPADPDAKRLTLH